ncbi:MAG: hypothetical protein ABI855_10740 [Bacteroidota bacterium]
MTESIIEGWLRSRTEPISSIAGRLISVSAPQKTGTACQNSGTSRNNNGIITKSKGTTP